MTKGGSRPYPFLPMARLTMRLFYGYNTNMKTFRTQQTALALTEFSLTELSLAVLSLNLLTLSSKFDAPVGSLWSK
jgi:hypothetical protein